MHAEPDLFAPGNLAELPAAAPKPKRSKSRPTTRSMEFLRKQGYLVAVVEKWIPQTKQRKDMFDLFDIVALKDGEIAFVQTTSDDNLSKRIAKITEHPNIDRIRRSGARLLAHGWKKRKGKWCAREVDVS